MILAEVYVLVAIYSVIILDDRIALIALITKIFGPEVDLSAAFLLIVILKFAILVSTYICFLVIAEAKNELKCADVNFPGIKSALFDGGLLICILALPIIVMLFYNITLVNAVIYYMRLSLSKVVVNNVINYISFIFLCVILLMVHLTRSLIRKAKEFMKDQSASR